MKVMNRRKKILDILKEQGSVTVNELVERLETSPATVRRDLDQMKRESLLQRTLGGAIEIGQVGIEPSYQNRLLNCPQEKRMIAKSAARMIMPGEIVALDTGTTVTQVAREITGLVPLTVVTPSLAVGEILGQGGNEEFTLIMPGGVMRNRTLSLVGPLCEKNIREFKYDKAILSCHAISTDTGAMNMNLLASGSKRAIVESSKQVIILADHTKFNKTGLTSFVGIEKIDTIITDWHTSSIDIENFRKKGIEVVIALEETNP